MAISVTLQGDPADVAAFLRSIAGGASQVAETIPEPYQNHTAPSVTTVPVEAPWSSPAPVAVPLRRHLARQPDKPAKPLPQTAPSDDDLELLGALTDDLRQAVHIAVQLGQKRTACGGVARKLDRLAGEGRCERGDLPNGKRGYRRLGAATPLPEPAEATAPLPLAALPARPPSLRIGDLVGHSVKVAWVLNDRGPQALGELAAATDLPQEDVRETIRLLIKQGYVHRLSGNVIRYDLTADVVREVNADA